MSTNLASATWPTTCLTTRSRTATAAWVASKSITTSATWRRPKSLSIDAVTLDDPILQELTRMLLQGRFEDNELVKPYKHVFGKLGLENGLILRGEQIVMPTALQSTCVTVAHQGHQCIIKTKALVRSKVWFPGVDRAVELAFKDCLPCQANTPGEKIAPLQMSDIPAGPWV